MLQTLAVPHERRPIAGIPEIGFCEEKNRLMGEFLRAIQELNAVHALEMRAVIAGDANFHFDHSIQTAQQKKEDAKCAWIEHVESHHCEEA